MSSAIDALMNALSESPQVKGIGPSCGSAVKVFLKGGYTLNLDVKVLAAPLRDTFGVSRHDPDSPADELYFTVRGIAPEGVSHYELEKVLKGQGWTNRGVDFDSEIGEFFAYCNNQEIAEQLRVAAEREAHWLVSA